VWWRNIPLQTSVINSIEEVFRQVKIIDFNGVKLVVKEYTSERGIIKWFLIKAAGLTSQVYPYTFKPVERMKREIDFFEGSILNNTPKIIVKDWLNKLIIREYIDGNNVNPLNREDVVKVAKTIADIHECGYSLGDSKYTNFIISNDRVYIVDAEQAIYTDRYEYMYWDIMVFLTTLIYSLIEKMSVKATSLSKSLIEVFISKYLEYGGRRSERVLECYNRFNYRTLIYILLPIPYSLHYVNALNKFL